MTLWQIQLHVLDPDWDPVAQTGQAELHLNQDVSE